MSFTDYYAFRDEVVGALVEDLLGPAEPEEIIEDAPITRYITGILFPADGSHIDPTEDLEESDDYDEAALPDPPVSMANRRYPSSMGITFAVDPQMCKLLRIDVSAARYQQLEDESEEKAPRSFRRGTGPGERWKRVPLEEQTFNVDPSKPTTDRRENVADGLQLFCRVRPPTGDGHVSITVGLINIRDATRGSLRDADSFFQPRIHVSDIDGSPVFVERLAHAPTVSDEDLLSYRLLYRHARSFGTGHGCSVDWTADPGDETRAVSIRSSFIPQYNLRLAETNPNIQADSLTMSFLAEAEKPAVLDDLREFCGAYETWIDGLGGQKASLEEDLRGTAERQIEGCREALERMRRGIDLLKRDGSAWSSFQLANEAMLNVRARTVWLRGNKATPSPVTDQRHRWRPFQLAFILLCLEGITDANSKDRQLADLLWFPTGGGKTEAYLGLIAYVVFLRRLRHSDRGGGVTALMRYTMRLLTIQQFERAALLIATCEHIRRARSDLGDEPISIGLWIGKGGTPNTLRDARLSLDKIRSGQPVEEANPVQLHSCPWCGYPLDHRNYYLSSGRVQLIVSCRQKDCEFRDELPVHLVDDQIYRLHPTLIVATVDKFASLPWREEVANLFNLHDSAIPAPELIIQDELHLISGPLGTLTGLYETAIDYLCSRDGVRPKVVASTATIRRASDQTRGLFDREVKQFPPPGLDARDSYFAIEADPEDRGTRRYVGVMAPATSQTTLLVRTYAALLQRVGDIEAEPRVKDPYWTLIGYFNSLRVLGGARMQVQDDVNDRIALLAGGRKSDQRTIERRIELTSREPSGEIPSHLKRMSVEYPNEDVLDVILATNMISVGVDIDRLGLMAVMGQPQSTSEYIQSTSRVGRQFPGLVVVLLNSARSRDRSHYESFVAYHSALYRQVESTSVTPFSPRARDRGLHAIVIALARMLVPALMVNSGAVGVEKFVESLEIVKQVVLSRVAKVAPEEKEATSIQLDALIDEWKKRAAETPDLVFSNQSHPDRALLVDASRDDLEGEGTFLTLWSLRDVDRASNLYLVR